MTFHFATAALLLMLSVSAMAQETVTPEGSQPLNLSLPREARWSSTASGNRASPDVSPGNTMGLPNMGSRSAGNSSRMPYGTGYEARQRNFDASGSDTGSAMGRGHGGGGRMGRGR
jgi:hypothetical protein